MRRLLLIIAVLTACFFVGGAFTPEGPYKISTQFQGDGPRPVVPGGEYDMPFNLPNFPLYALINYQSCGAYTTYPGGRDQYIEDMAGHDLVLWQVWCIWESEGNPSCDDFVDDIRAINPNSLLFSYLNIFSARYDWEDAVANPHLAAIWDEMDNDGHATINNWLWEDETGLLVDPTFVDTHPYNRSDTAAEIISRNFLEMRDDSEQYRKWTGVFFDFVDYPEPNNWFTQGYPARDYMDIDRDGVPYSSDTTDERPLHEAYYDSVVTVIARGMEDDFGGRSLIIANGVGGNHSYIRAKIDISMLEWFDNQGTKSIGYWSGQFNSSSGNFRNDRLSSGLVWWLPNHRTDLDVGEVDTLGFYWAEAFSMVSKGLCSSYGRIQDYTNTWACKPIIRDHPFDFGKPVGDSTFEDQGDNWCIATTEYELGVAMMRLPITGYGNKWYNGGWDYIIKDDIEVWSASDDWPPSGYGPTLSGMAWSCLDVGPGEQELELESDEDGSYRYRTAVTGGSARPAPGSWGDWSEWQSITAGLAINEYASEDGEAGLKDKDFVHVEIEVKNNADESAAVWWDFIAITAGPSCP